MTENADARSSDFSGWRIVAITFVILNCSLGVNFVAYGALVEGIQRDFHTTRALASAGLSMLTLSMGLLSPVVGMLMRRVPLKALMIAGVLLNAAGFALISRSDDIAVLLASYGLLIGPGFAMSAVIPCTAIIGNWFVEGRGKALGTINMPLGNAVLPLAAAYALSHYGLHFAFGAGAALLLALVPLIAMLVERPSHIGQRALGEGSGGPAGAAALAAPPMSSRRILCSMPFLVVTLAVGTLSAGGLVMVTQLVAIGTGRGLDLAAASSLLAAFGLAGVAGAPIFGWLADRLGGGLAFATLALAMVVPWLGLLVAGESFPLLLLLSALIGLCSNGVVTLFGVTLGEWLGQENLGLSMGLCYMLQIPFLFGAAPLAGAMFDATGGYTMTILLHVASFALIGLIFLLYRPSASVAVIASRPAAA